MSKNVEWFVEVQKMNEKGKERYRAEKKVEKREVEVAN